MSYPGSRLYWMPNISPWIAPCDLAGAVEVFNTSATDHLANLEAITAGQYGPYVPIKHGLKQQSQEAALQESKKSAEICLYHIFTGEKDGVSTSASSVSTFNLMPLACLSCSQIQYFILRNRRFACVRI